MEKEFIELVNSNRALIFKVCNLYCHDHESRKDLFQEVVLQLWRSFPSFKKESTSSTWIYRVALNTAISNFRKESKKPDNVSISVYDFEIPAMPGTDSNENMSMLYTAINHLSEIEKAIILLYLDEKTYDEISEIIGITNTNVGARLNRIKTKLSKLIKTAL
jgi:RNA polymerase sigma-70 factor (ECF subfamily)